MSTVKIGILNLLNKKLNSILSLMLMAFGVTLICILINANKQIQKNFQNNLAGVDLVVGAKGSPLQIILCTIFHLDYPTGNIKESDIKWLVKNRLVKKTIPISLGDSYKGYRIVGCDTSYTGLYNAKILEGSFFNDNLEVVVGNNVANHLKLSLGDHFSSSHGFEDDNIMSHDEHHFTVKGILESTGLVIDNLILCSNESVRMVHHSESNSDNKEITALLLEFRNPLAAVQLPRQINSRSNLQAASPSFEAARIFSLLDKALDIVKYIGSGIIVMAGLSIFISLFISLKDRQYELALLRSFGASRIYIFSVILSEALILAISGYVLGLILCHLGLFAYGFFDDSMNSYSLNPGFWVTEEFYLFIFAILIAVISGIIPAIRAYSMDISKTLSKSNA